MHEVRVTISKEAEVTVEAIGSAGPGCRELTANLERSLGRTSAVETKPEYHQPANQGLGQAQAHGGFGG